MNENELSFQIIGIAIDLHRNVGPGLLESAYEHALLHDLKSAGLDVKSQVPMPFIYKAVRLEIGYRIDLIVNDKVLIEVKSIEELAPVHYAQTLTFLKLSGPQTRPTYEFQCESSQGFDSSNRQQTIVFHFAPLRDSPFAPLREMYLIFADTLLSTRKSHSAPPPI